MADESTVTIEEIEEKVVSRLQPDAVLPARYFETFRRQAHLEPEKRLMLAVLEDGITCFQKHVRARNRKEKCLFSEAEEWILEEDSDCVFSFENVCEVVGFDPNCVRRSLIRWKDRLVSYSLEASHHVRAGNVRKPEGTFKGSGKLSVPLVRSAHQERATTVRSR
jgi:hypothetical protein